MRGIRIVTETASFVSKGLIRAIATFLIVSLNVINPSPATANEGQGSFFNVVNSFRETTIYGKPKPTRVTVHSIEMTVSLSDLDGISSSSLQCVYKDGVVAFNLDFYKDYAFYSWANGAGARNFISRNPESLNSQGYVKNRQFTLSFGGYWTRNESCNTKIKIQDVKGNFTTVDAQRILLVNPGLPNTDSPAPTIPSPVTQPSPIPTRTSSPTPIPAPIVTNVYGCTNSLDDLETVPEGLPSDLEGETCSSP